MLLTMQFIAAIRVGASLYFPAVSQTTNRVSLEELEQRIPLLRLAVVQVGEDGAAAALAGRARGGRVGRRQRRAEEGHRARGGRTQRGGGRRVPRERLRSSSSGGGGEVVE